MRLNLKIALCLVIIGAFFTTVSYWTKCGDQQLPPLPPSSSRLTQPRAFLGKYSPQEFSKDELYGEELAAAASGSVINPPQSSVDPASTVTTAEIDCVINGEYTVSCRREGSEVYVPFSFLHKYFEVYGKMTSSSMAVASAGGDGQFGGTQDRFEWQHSYSKYYVPKGVYNPRGPFMNFENFNVEARDRVKCISAMEGVPVSTQWDVRGYLYPIQIAQFALSHFSKNRTESKPRTATVYEDGQAHRATWSTPDGFVRRRHDSEVHSDVMDFKTTESLQDPGISLPLDQTQEFVLSLNLRLQDNGSVTVIVEDRDRRERHYLHYVDSDAYISLDGNHIFYGFGSRPGHRWTRLTRDLMVDLRKGLAMGKQTQQQQQQSQQQGSRRPNGGGYRTHSAKSRLVGLILHGQGSIDNLTLSSSDHVTHFVDGADWLVRHQDEGGGWPIPVERKFVSSGMGNLAPGWYSAMAQGQAMSVLTRAYHVTGDRRYLTAASRALGPFEASSERNGVRARFLDRYVWYEEYPTVPSSFVLNGFMYSLVGLYDLMAAHQGRASERASLLYDEGMRSLRTLLPLFDSGTGSFYDLRHVTLGVAPNLARWDYHTTHIGQLLLLATVDDSAILRTTADRWIEYMKGKRAPHN